MSYGDWMIVLVFVLMMSVAGLAKFLNSEYAQKKWNPEGK